MPCDYKDYPPNWRQIRTRILQRANFHCECCGIENNTYKRQKPNKHGYVRLTRIVLTIAHLDHDKENWSVADDRLKALCQACHLAYDLPRHIENRKYGRNHRKNQLRLL